MSKPINADPRSVICCEHEVADVKNAAASTNNPDDASLWFVRTKAQQLIKIMLQQKEKISPSPAASLFKFPQSQKILSATL